MEDESSRLAVGFLVAAKNQLKQGFNMRKMKVSIVVGIIFAALLVVAISGVLLHTKDSKQTTAPGADAETSDSLVAKTGVCKMGQVKHLSTGTYTVGTDFATGEYTVSYNNKNDGGVQFEVYPSKDSYTSDVNNYTDIALLSPNVTRSVKFDSGNYITVNFGGKLTCN